MSVWLKSVAFSVSVGKICSALPKNLRPVCLWLRYTLIRAQFKTIFTLYRIACRATQNPYRIGPVFTYEMIDSYQFVHRRVGAARCSSKWYVLYRVGFGNAVIVMLTTCSDSSRYLLANRHLFSNLIYRYSLQYFLFLVIKQLIQLKLSFQNLKP